MLGEIISAGVIESRPDTTNFYECSIATDRGYANWFIELKRGRVDLRDECGDGRPSTAVNDKNIGAVRCTIETNKHVTYYEFGHP
ncbi:hypothetical protein EVAR_39032_1 [Eumeta japonica]|uniref:Uncharacterized protein n=1 Tax=Eumeta variegata TaxID=151549 RepID=A0A4C1WNB4_EUMVA|nr:hypothetical protein EVAR_39032_1 [Eumeta japonica]